MKSPGDRRPLSPAELAAARGALPPGNPLQEALERLRARAGFSLPAETNPPNPPNPPAPRPPLLGDVSHAAIEAVQAAAYARVSEADAREAARAGGSAALAREITGGDPNAGDDGAYRFGAVGRAIGDVAARIVKKTIWLTGRMDNPKIMEKNIRTHGHMIPPPKNWARDVLADYEREWCVGEVSFPYFERVVRGIEGLGKAGRGYVRGAYKGLANLIRRVGRETVRRVIRWLRDHGHLGIKNVLVEELDESGKRVGLRRAENLYFLFGKADRAPAIAAARDEAEAPILERRYWDFVIQRAARLFRDVVANPYGVNATVRRRQAPA